MLLPYHLTPRSPILCPFFRFHRSRSVYIFDVLMHVVVSLEVLYFCHHYVLKYLEPWTMVLETEVNTNNSRTRKIIGSKI